MLESGRDSGDRRRRRRRLRRSRPPPPPSAGGGSDSDVQSWHSPFDTAAGGSLGECTSFSGVEGVSDPQSDSSFSDCLSEVDLESGVQKLKKVRLGKKVERECRICKLSLEGARVESGGPIDLGCSCKGDLGAAHRKCAETWFQTRGNTTCEICGGTAVNIACEQANEANRALRASTATPAEHVTVTEDQSFWRSRRFMNLLLACMVLAFIVSWLFHYHVFS